MSIANEFISSARIEDNAMPPGIPIDSNDWKQDVSHFTYANKNIETVIDRICDIIGPYDNESYFENRNHEIVVEEPYYGDIMEELKNQADIEDRLRIQHEWKLYAAERYHQEMKAYHAAERYHQEMKAYHEQRRMAIYTRYCRQQSEAEQAMRTHRLYEARQVHFPAQNTTTEKKPRRHYRYRRGNKKNNKKKTNVIV